MEKPDGNPETWHIQFRTFISSKESDPVQDLRRLRELCHLWLRPDLHTKEQIMDRLVLEQFMICMPLECQVLVKKSGVETCQELEDMLINQQKPKKWTVVCIRGQDFLVPVLESEILEVEVSDMDDERNERRTPKENMEQDLVEDKEDTRTPTQSQEPELLKGPGRVKTTSHAKGKEAPGGTDYQCRECNKRFHYRSQFTLHKRTHTGERPFQCSLCAKAFMQPSDLRVHQRIHTGEKPYRCDTCSRDFTHDSTLRAHKRTHTKERPFPCEQCDMAFSKRGNLNVHRRTHSGLKPYVCPECHGAFRQLGTFKRHQKTHFKTTSQ
ncbi:zinc finger and SCAN domain-containing protein 5B-like [Phacochoerus africanus]|uniref:zinc finger and SCAN domain-containing protein 5B-like n=1 Tax=Phacochoerus africanus TaxID=41426 RepID=UPI001FD930B9|nr:zinc finger and SCAN domain-containing protein 5B-like [Phacochoerus africanus]